MPGRNESPRFHVAHRLLRARDWQDRPQLGHLRAWWRSGAGGVCALVGIGGAGKTAIADRFVRSLSGVLATPDVDVDASLRPPRGLFVFSFYDAPNADTFFTELFSWLDGAADSASVSYERTVRRLEREDGVLLVLDGLEKVQDPGKRSGWFGRLLDNRLRDLVLRAAEGWLPGVRLLITSRFQLFDALAEGSPRFRQIAVEELSAEASVALLRRRGVRGPDHLLVDLARDQGSYVRESSEDVARLREDLVRLGETVWWDQDIPPGANWRLAIYGALQNAYAFVLCLSKEMASRDVSGAFPEIRDAIAIHRERSSFGSFIFPVRLSESEIPIFEIDATTKLSDLQCVDLFPESERPEALRRLVAALEASPGRPRSDARPPRDPSASSLAQVRRSSADQHQSGRRCG